MSRGDEENSPGPERRRPPRPTREERAQQREDRQARGRGRDRGGSIFARPEPGRRKPTLSRDAIVAAAMALADREGWDALSMRKVAAELGTGTMTIYHYIATKEELFSLIDDALMAEVLLSPEELELPWRAGMETIARKTRDLSLNHPWTKQMPAGTRGGPNGLRHVEQSLRIANRTGLELRDALELMVLVDDYVFGYVQRAFDSDKEDEREQLEEAIDYFDGLLASGEYPALAAMGDGGAAEGMRLMVGVFRDPERFERGLRSLLDGIELQIQRARPD